MAAWYLRSRADWWAEWLALAAAFVVPAWLSWQRWTDPLVDYGRQAYVAWRILEGDRLYTDLAHVFGPLGSYLSAAVMGLLGTSIASLVWFNLFLIGCFTLLLRSLFGWIGGRLSGLGAALAFLLLCAFPQYVFQANFNFVTPYSGDLVYGLMLAFVCLSLILRGEPAGISEWRMAAGGACFALVMLGKPEVFLALVLAVMAACLCMRCARRQWLAFLGSALATLMVVFVAFVPSLGNSGALHAVLAGLIPVGKMGSAGLLYYRWVSGFDAPWQNLARALAGFLAVLLCAAAGLMLERLERVQRVAAVALGTVLLVSLPAMFLLQPLETTAVQQGLGFLPLVVIAVALLAIFKRRRGTFCARANAWLVLSVFALGSLLKIVLAARLFHYGFALSMPAVALVVARLLADPTQQVRVWWWRRLPLFALGLALVLAHLDTSRRHYALRNLELRSDGEHMRVFGEDRDARGPWIQAFLDWQEKGIAPGTTMLVLPDAAMLNFLSRHAAGTPYYALPSPELAFHGEAAVLTALRRQPPDFVVLVDQGGVLLGRFGQAGYGREILAWVATDYEPLVLFGAEPLTGQGFGIGVLRYRH